jgi:hypothetical protein
VKKVRVILIVYSLDGIIGSIRVRKDLGPELGDCIFEVVGGHQAASIVPFALS